MYGCAMLCFLCAHYADSLSLCTTMHAQVTWVNPFGLESMFMYVRETGTHRPNCCVCQMNRHVVTIDGYVDVAPNNEEQLLQAVAAQPVSVGLCGSERAFQLYSKVCSLSIISQRHDRNVK